MNSIIQSDIFFFVTTISIVVVTGFLVYVFLQIIKILKTIKEISEEVKVEGSFIIKDISEMRNSLKEKSKLFSGVMTASALATLFKNVKKNKKNEK